jgi:hypothetical protein
MDIRVGLSRAALIAAVLLTAGALAIAGCSDEATSATTAGGWYNGGGTSKTDAGSGDYGNASDAGSSGTQTPPEVEVEPDFGAPEGSPNYVYIPAAGTDRIVRVSGQTLKVSLIEVSSQPTVLQVIPGIDAAVALHRGSDEAAIIRSSEAGDNVVLLPVIAHCNALAMAPSGSHAVVWYDHARAKPGDPVGSFQALSLLQLTAGQEKSLSVSVGFRPRSVTFAKGGAQALVVTDDGVSILELGKIKDGDIVASVPLSKTIGKADREVLISDDGQWAVVRETGSTKLGLVHLPSKKIGEVDLGAVPTDLDLVPGGASALAVLRDAGQVAMVTLPAQVTDTFEFKLADLGGAPLGLARLTEDGKTALLYTSVAGIEQVATLDIATGNVTPVAIKKTIDNALLVPGTRKAILLHKPGAGPGYSDLTEKFVDDSQGYTLYDLDTGYTKLVLTPVKPLEVALSQGPDKAWLLLPDPKGLAHLVQEADLTSFQTVDHPLGSAPEHGRYLQKAGVVAVTQTHPSGRITFLDAKTGQAKTVTGFELNGQVN